MINQKFNKPDKSRTWPIILLLWLFTVQASVLAEDERAASALNERQSSILTTLDAIVETEKDLLERIGEVTEKIEKTASETGKQELKKQESQLRDELQATRKSFDEIAAENDIAILKGERQGQFDLKNEVLFLLEPALKEMKRMTSGVRNKSALREKLEIYRERMPIAERAIANLESLLKVSKDEDVTEALEDRLSQWKHQLNLLDNDRRSVQLQLDKLEANEVSLAQASQSYFKEFFQKRGLYLLVAFGVVLLVVLLSKLSAAAMHAVMPGFRAEHRSFRVRLIQLIHQLFSFILAIIGPMVVFYLVEDWVLFSLGILILFAAAWTIRSAVPRYWHQMQLFLNIGSVREGERIEMDGIPWLVKQINLYTLLENPVAGLQLRFPIDHMVGLTSRPLRPHEPWFPCKSGDWVILSDGRRGKIVGISKELVQMVERGGALRTYTMSDFLALAPHNLSTNFRLKEVLGVSYDLQPAAAKEIPQKLQAFIRQKAEQEGLADKVLNLRVELSAAGASSLDITVIIDFDGDLAELYGRLRRTLQRWCVEACTAHDWEIPFPQMTIHRPALAG